MSRILIEPPDLERTAVALEHTAEQLQVFARSLLVSGHRLPEPIAGLLQAEKARVARGVAVEALELVGLARRLHDVAEAARRAGGDAATASPCGQEQGLAARVVPVARPLAGTVDIPLDVRVDVKRADCTSAR